LSDINKISISRQIFIKDLGIKFHENPSSGKGVDTCGQMDGQTEMTMLLEVFHYHSNTPDNVQHAQIYLFIAYYLSLVTGSMLDYGRFIPTCGNSSKYVLVLTHSMEHSPS